MTDQPTEYEGDWIECWQCNGEGALDDCFEDTCVCLDPPCTFIRCDVCEGWGGWNAEDAARAVSSDGAAA